MLRKNKILSFLLCFCLLFEQTGFAQVAGALDISGHLAAFRNQLIQDKFRPLHLRSLGYDNAQNNFRLLLDKGDLKNPKKPDLETTTKTLLNYFFVGVTLPNDTFWVNLRPDSENNIIDPDLATTDVGKILLEADLQLKKDTAKFTSPETPEGKEYWEKLYQKAGELLGYENITIPTLTRPWIVPGEIIIRETKDNAYIYKATLKVMLEQDYLKDSATYNFDDPRLKTLNEYSSQLIRDLIIPKLTKEVNTSQRYAPLRQVYYSLILAQWFKSRFYGKGGLYSWLIDRRGLQGLTSKFSWSKTTYFKAYQKSFKDGEYNIQQPVYTPYGQTVRSYFSGGFVCNVPMPAVPAPGVAAERTEGPTKVTAISGDNEHNPLPRTDTVVGALAVGGNTMDPSETRVTITEEASSPSGLPAGGLQSGASSVSPTATNTEETQVTAKQASSPNLGAQVSDVKHLDRLLRLLNVLRRSENVPEVPENASDRDVMEFCIKYLQAKGLITTTTDEEGNVIITINNNALNHPDETVRRFVEAIQRWVINPEGGVRAVNFQGKDGVWMIVGFESELQNKDTLEHEQQEIKFRKQGLSWTEAHNQAVAETGKGQRIDREEAAKRRAGRQDEIGAMQGGSFTPKESRRRLIADRLGIPVAQMSQWERANPEKANRLEEMAERDDRTEVFLKDINSRYAVIDRNNPKFTHLYSETEGIVRRLLKAAGFNPDNFELYLLDSTAENAFIVRYGNKIFVNIGLIKFIVENGGSKDALAFVLAHEIRHILQWVDDTIEGKPIEKGLAGLVGRHADEYDADYALALIDKAGYSVRDAGFFFAKFIEKKGKGRGILGFLTHPPTVERLRKIERDVMKFFWMNFFNKSESFSEETKQELNNRTNHRLFQQKALQPIQSVRSLGLLMKEASTPEEFIFLLYAQANNFNLTSELQKEIKEYFLRRFAGDSRAKQTAYGVIIDIAIADLMRMQTGTMFSRGGTIQNHQLAMEIKKRFESMSLEELIELFSIPLIAPLMNYAYDRASGSYQEDGKFPDFNYTDLIGILSFALSERLKVLFNSGQLEIDEMIKLMQLFKQRYFEANTYSKMGLPQDINSFLEKLISMSLQLLIKNKDKTKDIQYLETIIPYFDLFEEIRSMHGGGTLIMADFCEYLKTAEERVKQFVLDNWILRGDKSSELKDEFFMRMAGWPDYVGISLMEILPGLGNGAESDLGILFANPYFAKYSIFNSVKKGKGFGLHDVNILIAILQNLVTKYNLSPEQAVGLCEYAMHKLRGLAITGKLEGLYETLYREMGEFGSMKIGDAVKQKIELDSGIPKELNPEVKKLIYFYKMGGVLGFRELRRAFFSISARHKNVGQPDFGYQDVQAFYNILMSLSGEIKGRYEEKENSEKELRWNKYVLPFALFLSFDRQALSEEESRYDSTAFQHSVVVRDADGKPVRDENGELKTEVVPGQPTRFGRFVGEFNPFGTLTRFGSRDDYKKTKVDRGRGINRVFLAGEEVDALLRVFDYIATSDKYFETLFNEISRGLPATAYRNLALYILFVEKFLKQECGVSIDAAKMFDLVYIQSIIDSLSPQDKTMALPILSRLSSLMVRDTEMEQFNEPNQNVLGKLEDAERQRISTEHASEEAGYYPAEFTELGGALSQLDIFVGLLAENSILGALKSVELSFGEKLDIILKHFTRDSNTRDRFLTLLIENNLNTATSADIEKVLPLFNNESFREKYAVVALEKKRSENPEDFSTLEGELKWILHYFPELSPTRDDILLQLIDEKANTPGDMKKIRPYLLKAPENIREKKQARVVFGTSVFEEYMRNQDAADKMEFLLWALGISDKKPFFLKRFEHEYNVSLNGMRDSFMKRRAGYYKNVGDSALEEFLERIFLGEKGIFYDEKVSAEFLDVLFNTLMPSQKNNIMRVVYDAIFRRADVNRKYAIVAALLKNFSREKSSPEGINEARAIRIFLESLGLIGVKIAQFLSTYEVVPENVRNELKLLKDRAPQLSKDIVFDMIAKIYGSFEDSPISEVLECIGSASIKVVYRARLKDGREIVIKIKRPEVEKKVEEDLAFLRDILSDQTVQDALRANDVEIPQQLGNRIAEMILEEMNLKGEVENQDRLGEGVSPASSFRRRVMNRIFNYFISKVFKTPQRKYSFRVPATIDVQNNTLIIEDFVSGRRIGVGDEDAMVAVARELMRQIFLDGFYHADPHTGNIFVGSEGGVIYFIDVGSASQISLKNRYLLYQLMKALESGDGKKVLRVINKMAGQSMPELARNADDIAASRENVVKKIIMVFKALEDAHVTVDKELISIFRCFGQGETLFRSALLSEEGSSTGTGTKGSSPIDRGFEGDIGEVDAKAFADAWRSGRSVEISQEHLDVLQDSSMGPAFRVPQIRLISRQIMDGIAQGANVVRLGNQVLVVGAYWNSLSEDERLDVLMHEGMADWLERERPGMPAEDAAIDLEGLRRNEAERRAEHRGEGQQTEDTNMAPGDFSRSNAGEVAGSPVNQRVDTSEAAKTQTSSGQVDKKGGIDFRALPIINQQINMGMLKLSPADLNRLGNINLDSEWVEIQNMVKAGIIPSNERVKEYILASCLRQNLGNQMNKVLGCIADIMRMEEDRVVDADVELKDMLVLIEAGKPETELQCGLSQIKISPQEPKLVVP